MYFLYKEGAYGHGVFWIGEDLEEGARQANLAAYNDVDGYHSWNLYKYNSTATIEKGGELSGEHKLVYTGERRD